VIVQLVLIAALVATNAFFAAAEIAVVSANRLRLRRLAEDGDRRASQALRLASESGRFLATVQIGVTLSGFLASAVGAISVATALAGLLRAVPVPFIAEQADGLAVLVVTIAIALLTLILGELLPKNLAVRNAESVALAVATPIVWLERLTRPMVWCLNSTTNFLIGGTSRVRFPTVTSEEIVAYADVAEEEGSIDSRERQIVQGALTLGERHIGELVVPRVDVKALPSEATLDDARVLIVQTGHSRIPIYRQTVDDVVGVLHSRDLLAADVAGTPGDRPVAEIARTTIFVPETVRADEVLRDMQRQRMHLAVVVDEFGGTAGIVTLENLLEELVGPIRDEYDAAEQPEIRIVADGEVVASGDADLDHIAESLETRLEDETVDTVGGLVYATLGRIPAVGDTMTVQGISLEVLRMQGNRVSLVRLARAPKAESGD
jgi:putative hemolysin